MDVFLNSKKSMERRNSLHLEVEELKNSTIFEPRRDSSSQSYESPEPTPVQAPEKRLTVFALRLAVLEKAATGLGTLGFIWATVVLLGGFAITLDKTDFWFITVILLIEGARIFSRSHELEWQHQSTWSIAFARTIGSFRGNFRTQRRFPGGRWIFVSSHVSKLLNWLQVASATACMLLSLTKLVEHNYGEAGKGDIEKRNRNSALYIFYSLALSEALLFLLEKVYWDWKIVHCGLFQQVNQHCELGESGLISIRRFFYDAYSKCLDGSIFDGLKMDMISFSMDLLTSPSPDEQLIGARVLKQFSLNQRFSDHTLQKIGISLPVMEKMLEMLNWKGESEEEIRYAVAIILSKLAGKKQNALRVAGIPGAMESISSLLCDMRNGNGSTDEISEKRIIHHGKLNYCFYSFNYLGLTILKKLARDQDNCGKIGNTRGLLPKIIDLMHAEETVLKEEKFSMSEISTIKRSLQVIKLLVSSSGRTGHLLRNEISEVVFTISNIRNILRHGEKFSILQKLGIQILTNLALEDGARERIGGTGGILKELLRIFLKQDCHDDQETVKTAAGEALGTLVLESESNCNRILRSDVIPKLVEALNLPSLRINSARILRNLCIYSAGELFDQLKSVTLAAPTALRAIMSEENKAQEVMLGLAAQIFRFTTPEESASILDRAGIEETDLAGMVVQILRRYPHPPIHIPRIRRFGIEMAIWMMKDLRKNILIFRKLGMEEQLENVRDSISEVECFNIFSGMVGISRHTTTMHSLVDDALKLLTCS